MQAETNIWVRSQNSNAPRADRHKILPHGIPSMIRSKPHEWDALDFKVIFFTLYPATFLLSINIVADPRSRTLHRCS